MKSFALLALFHMFLYGAETIAIDTPPNTLTTETKPAVNEQILWVDERVAAIKPARSGLPTAMLKRVHNPFLFTAPVVTRGDGKAGTGSAVKGRKPAASAKSRSLKLYAIMNDKALINGLWFATNDKIRAYRVAKINEGSVVLKRGRTVKRLFIAKPNPAIHITVN